MRFIHVDEAGTAHNEPYAVVAGVVTHADRQWKSLNQYLADMASDLVPHEHRDGLVFHAKDLWHGKGRFNTLRWPDVWTRERRVRIMSEIAMIPVKFDIPVVTGIIRKSDHAWDGVTGHHAIDASHYALAFGLCAGTAEYFMRTCADEDEVALLVAEDARHMRKHAQWGYAHLKNPEHDWGGESERVTACLPITRIVEDPHFVSKDASSILQIADLVAFTLCRRINGKMDMDDLVRAYASQLIILPSWLTDFADHYGLEPSALLSAGKPKEPS